MTRQQAEQFINAYNMLLTISTKGDDTRTMANVLGIMEQLASSIQLVDDTPSITPVDVNGEIGSIEED